jgi:hypothetical protein
MPCRCFSCNLSFDTVRALVEHKFTAHKPVYEEPPWRDTTLRCEEPMSTSSSQAAYRNDILSPNCEQPTKVVVQKGEAVATASKAH